MKIQNFFQCIEKMSLSFEAPQKNKLFCFQGNSVAYHQNHNYQPYYNDVPNDPFDIKFDLNVPHELINGS